MSPENKDNQYYIISLPTESKESFESLMNHMPEWRIVSKSDGLESFVRDLAKLFGRQGGITRAAALTPAERSEIARNAANTRWASRPQQTQ
ncbi:MAG: hypothetical protein Q8P25_01915 [Candidatus Curtissbacteria bacterium]|nr:hypothetical protein [Candidatus Curtissbacteria bacterium]